MRTSLNNIYETEQYLRGQLTPEDRLAYEAWLIVDEDLKEQARWQQHTYAVVRAYGRMQMKNKLEQLYERLMNEPQHTSFKNRILKIFSL